jgi:hypothetical protein
MNNLTMKFEYVVQILEYSLITVQVYAPFQWPLEGGRQVSQISYKFRLMLKISYEDLVTFLAQVEAILNYRPLTTISSDPNYVSALTHGRFLVGRPLNAIPEHVSKKKSKGSTFERLIKKVTELQECLLNILLRQRRKQWTISSPTSKEGTLVLMN